MIICLGGEEIIKIVKIYEVNFICWVGESEGMSNGITF